jgi:hypothetical protein
MYDRASSRGGFRIRPAYVSRSGGAAEDVTRCWADADYELFALDPRRPPALVARLGDRGGNFLALPHGRPAIDEHYGRSGANLRPRSARWIFRLALVASHPVQYLAPWYRALAAVLSLKVFFAHRSARPIMRAAASTSDSSGTPRCSMDMLSNGWTNTASRPGVDHFWGCNTPVSGRHQAIRLRRCTCQRLAALLLLAGDPGRSAPPAFRFSCEAIHSWTLFSTGSRHPQAARVPAHASIV